MKVAVRLFAKARDLAGTSSLECEFHGPCRVSDLKQQLAARFPALAPLVPSLLVAVGTDYADDHTSLLPGAEVACFPPVSGG